MARRLEIAIVYLAGLSQGLSLVTFPAASTILTSPNFYNLTNSEYGNLFIPMVLCSILGSSLGPALARRWALKRLLLLGLVCNLLSMTVLVMSQFFINYHYVAYGLLLVAMMALGTGFGTTLTAIQTYAAEFFPQKRDIAILALQSLLGTGTALAPLLVSLFVRVAVWWLLPVVVGVGFLALALACVKQPLQAGSVHGPHGASFVALLREIPARFWVYAGIALLYGISETLYSNWATIYLHHEKGLTLHDAAFGLAAFWAMVTLGRVMATFLSVWVSPGWMYRMLPALILLAFVVIPEIKGTVGSIVAYGFAGVACSAFLPLSVSFAQRKFSQIVDVVSGGIMAAYMVGFGIASFGVGPLQRIGNLTLSTIYTGSSVLAVTMIVLAFLLTKGGKM